MISFPLYIGKNAFKLILGRISTTVECPTLMLIYCFMECVLFDPVFEYCKVNDLSVGLTLHIEQWKHDLMSQNSGDGNTYLSVLLQTLNKIEVAIKA